MIIGIIPDGCGGYPNDFVGSRLQNYCAYIRVDTNAEKLPNRLGADMFEFYLGNDGALYPPGGVETGAGLSWKNSGMYSMACGDPSSKSLSATKGYFCSARVMESGWGIDYDL